jgi:hypothetical protein
MKIPLTSIVQYRYCHTYKEMLGSPHYSEVISVDQEKTAKYKTLDLKAKFERIAGKEKAVPILLDSENSTEALCGTM